MTTKNFFFIVVLIVAFINLKCYAVPKSSASIGAIATISLTGDSSSIDATLLRSILLMAVQEINNKTDGLADDLLPSTTIRLAFSDPKDSYFEAISATQYLVSTAFNNAGTDVCIGSASFSIAKAMGEVLPQFFTAQFSYSDNSRFTFSSDYPNMFRITNSVDFQGRGLASLCYHFDWKMISVFASNDYFGSCALTEFQLRATELGMTILSAQQFIQHDTSLDDIIDRAASSYASIFVILADALDTLNLLQAGYDAGLFVEGTQVLGTSLAVAATTNVNAFYKGFIGLNPTVDLTNPKLLSFVKRVSLLKPTVTTLSSGKKVCSDLMDDNQGYIYKGKKDDTKTSSDYICAGIANYSQYSSPKYFNSSLFYAYDAIYAAFYAIHTQLYVYSSNALRHPTFIKTARNNISFEGITGNINFSSGLLGLSTFSAGSRRIGAYYQIVNYQPCIINNITGETTITTTTTTTTTTLLCAKNIGAWHGESGFKDCELAGFTNCASVVYNTADNSKPLDTPPTIIIYSPNYASYVLWIMAALIILIVIFFTIIMFIHHKLAIINHAQPILLLSILIGCLLGATRIIISIFQPTNLFCKTSMWLSHLSYIMVFGALLLKSYRIHLQVNPPQIMLKDSMITGGILSMIIIVSLYLCMVMWIVHSPPNATYITTYEHRVATKEAICHLDKTMYSIILFCVEGLLLLSGIRICWLINGVTDEVNEAKYIAPAIIGIAFICLVDFPAVYLLNLSPTSIRLVSSVGFFLAIIWTLGAQFGPKTYRIYIGDGDNLSDIISNNLLNKRNAISPTYAIKGGQPEEPSSDATNAANPAEIEEQPQQQEQQQQEQEQQQQQPQQQEQDMEPNKEHSLKEISPVLTI